MDSSLWHLWGAAIPRLTSQTTMQGHQQPGQAAHFNAWIWNPRGRAGMWTVRPAFAKAESLGLEDLNLALKADSNHALRGAPRPTPLYLTQASSPALSIWTRAWKWLRPRPLLAPAR